MFVHCIMFLLAGFTYIICLIHALCIYTFAYIYILLYRILSYISYLMSGSSASVTPSSAYLTPLTPGSAKGAYTGAGDASVADNVSSLYTYTLISVYCILYEYIVFYLHVNYLYTNMPIYVCTSIRLCTLYIYTIT